jgi:hypothetical protein
LAGLDPVTLEADMNRLTVLAAAAFLALVMPGDPARADPDKDESGKGREKRAERDGRGGGGGDRDKELRKDVDEANRELRKAEEERDREPCSRSDPAWPRTTPTPCTAAGRPAASGTTSAS